MTQRVLRYPSQQKFWVKQRGEKTVQVKAYSSESTAEPEPEGEPEREGTDNNLYRVLFEIFTSVDATLGFIVIFTFHLIFQCFSLSPLVRLYYTSEIFDCLTFFFSMEFTLRSYKSTILG